MKLIPIVSLADLDPCYFEVISSIQSLPRFDSLSLRLRWFPLTKPLPMSRRLILQQARRSESRAEPPPTAWELTVSCSISLPRWGFFSPFPHGTTSLSVTQEYLALQGGPC
ncbi:hypothetical protein VNO80_35416 [Phaseolus coccineus]|uniref:Uncharacterized protein n=1 Tax=Phaseolus coccineus TaxID=3886 RepID=A0AAN9KQC0_PHACN